MPAANKKISVCEGECPIQRSMEILEGKWTLLILRDLLGGTRRFGELRRSLGNVNPKTLSDRLHLLEEHSVLTRKVYAEVPPRVEYTLTEKGRALQNVVSALAKWGSQWTRTPS